MDQVHPQSNFPHRVRGVYSRYQKVSFQYPDVRDVDLTNHANSCEHLPDAAGPSVLDHQRLPKERRGTILWLAALFYDIGLTMFLSCPDKVWFFELIYECGGFAGKSWRPFRGWVRRKQPLVRFVRWSAGGETNWLVKY